MAGKHTHTYIHTQPERSERKSSLCGVCLIVSVCSCVHMCAHMLLEINSSAFSVYRPQNDPLYLCCPWQVKKWILSASTAFSTTIIPFSQPGWIHVSHTRQQLPLSDENDVVRAIWSNCVALWSSEQIRACSFIKQFRLEKITGKVFFSPSNTAGYRKQYH